MKITIERHRWDRGQGRHLSIANAKGESIGIRNVKAFDPSNTCCIFGFGFNELKSQEEVNKFAIDYHDLIVNSKAYDINDDPTIPTDEVREALLKEEFKKYGHEVEFKD